MLRELEGTSKSETSRVPPTLYIGAVKTAHENRGTEKSWKMNGKNMKRPGRPTSQSGPSCSTSEPLSSKQLQTKTSNPRSSVSKHLKVRVTFFQKEKI
jgi:hypothetical protein